MLCAIRDLFVNRAAKPEICVSFHVLMFYVLGGRNFFRCCLCTIIFHSVSNCAGVGSSCMGSFNKVEDRNTEILSLIEKYIKINKNMYKTHGKYIFRKFSTKIIFITHIICHSGVDFYSQYFFLSGNFPNNSDFEDLMWWKLAFDFLNIMKCTIFNLFIVMKHNTIHKIDNFKYYSFSCFYSYDKIYHELARNGWNTEMLWNIIEHGKNYAWSRETYIKCMI